MGDSAEVSTLSYMDVLLKSLDKSLAADRGAAASAGGGSTREEHVVPDSTTSHSPPAQTLRVGDDVLVPKQDGKYYLGSIIELSNHGLYDTESRCLIKFGDGTRSWAPTSNVKLLSAPPPDDGRLMCVVCKQREGAAGTSGAAVIACDMCGRGYHARCHTPVVETWIHGASWNCRRCVDQRYRVAAAENRAQKRSVVRMTDGRRVQFPGFSQQPCDTASTTSSTTSEQGKDESHCYCGEKSDWLAQMLMCCRCSRWFHQRCVSSLQYPLYAGDKMYIFACSTCNGGSEFLRRLELRWLDLAHLALYNLTAYNSRNYFDLDAVVMPYVMDNWHALQLPQKMWCTSVSERRERVLAALTGSRARFKSGREMKKRATIWGLRVRRPPPQPLHLNTLAQVKESEPLTDEVVSRLAPRLRFLTRTRSVSPTARHDTQLRNGTQPTSSNGNSSYINHNQNMIVPVDGHWLNLMMGKRFHQNLNSNDTENDSPCSSPSPTEFMNNTLTNHSAALGLRYDMLKMNDVSTDSTYTFDDEADNAPVPDKLTKSKQLRLYKYDYHNGGFVKKSVPFTKHSPSSKNKISSEDEKKKKLKMRQRNGEIDLNEKRLQNSAKEKKRETTPIRNFSNFLRNSRDKERSPSADPEIILKGDCSTSSFDSVKRLESEVVAAQSRSSSPSLPSELSGESVSGETVLDLPQRQSSVMDDITPSIQSNKLKDKDCPQDKPVNIQSAHTSKIAAMNVEISKMSTTSIIEHSKIMSLQQCRPEHVLRGLSNDRESSGDETLGRGTLDAIIPPLKDFHGKNNPFLMRNSAGKHSFSIANKLFSKQGKTTSPKNGIQQQAKSRFSLPMHLTQVIPPMRTLKRQLSEKDLIIGPNGEVKRKKLRRNRKNGQLNSSCPLPGDGRKASQIYPKQSDEVQQKVFNGRQLRQRQERNYFESGRRSGSTPAPTVPPVGALHLSPRKGEPPEQLSDLKSSVRSYFGAITRMKDGDAFKVTARRMSSTGQAQYLIEWASSHST